MSSQTTHSQKQQTRFEFKTEGMRKEGKNSSSNNLNSTCVCLTGSSKPASQHYHLSITLPSTADGSCTMRLLVQDVTLKEQPLPGVAGRVLLAVKLTTPRLLPDPPVLDVEVVLGQPVLGKRDCQVPATDTPDTPALL